MTDELLPSGKLALHNRFGHEVIRSAVEAIDDVVANQIGEHCDEELRAEIEERIVAAPDNDYWHRLSSFFPLH
ncbi:MAG: hypothetical protein HYU53_02555 [Acidobacteria bacterium]|nr:hypothetical protein [Acidobacteriota bacterium]